MRKAAPWIAAGAVAVLLVADIVIVAILRAEVGDLTVRVEGGDGLREEFKAARGEVERLAARLAELEGHEHAPPPSAPPVVKAPGDGLKPPRGALVATFDKSDEGWKCPEWATGSVLHATRAGMPRRGGGALALGYVYGDTPAAAQGPVSPGGRVSLIRFYARTRAREMTLGIGVVEAGGARYELKVPRLRTEEGWRLVSVPPSSMGPAKGSRDADRKLDLTKIVGVYVVDRTKDPAGGNVLLIDDLTIETFR